MKSINSYPKIYTLGHPMISDLFKDTVLIEEKVDGSQFSMMKKDGEYYFRSKGKELFADAPEKMFSKAVESAMSLDLREGWVYRCEYLQNPKHNSLAYDRVPEKHLILFDVCVGEESYLDYKQKKDEAKRIGIECVPVITEGMIESSNNLKYLLETESILGGQKIEGIVIKNYQRFGPDGKILIGKHVSENFKEKNHKEWKGKNKTSKDIIQTIIETYKTDARFDKAIIHLKEKGMLTGTPKDIGNLVKECQMDIKQECIEEIKNDLFRWAWPHLQRGVVRGLPEYYKNKLMEKQFEEAE